MYDSQIVAGDFVLLNFVSKRTNVLVEYVGRAEEKFEDGSVLVNYLKQHNNRRNEFVFPNVLQEETVKNDDIISVLPPPNVKRGHYLFPYDVII